MIRRPPRSTPFPTRRSSDLNDVFEPPFPAVYNSTTDTSFDFSEQSEFNITITNVTVVQLETSYQIGAKFSNTTSSVASNLEVAPFGFMLFTDWDFYLSNITAMLAEADTMTEESTYEVFNGKTEFKFFFNFTDGVDYGYLEERYDKTTGMVLYSKIDYSFSEVRSTTILKQKGYVIQEEVSSETTSSSSPTTRTSISSRTSSEAKSESKPPLSISGFEIFVSFSGIIAIISIKYLKKDN